MKTCSKCKKLKGLEDFHKNKAMRDGLANQCKPCANEAKSKWKKANRTACNKQYRRAYTKNPDKFKQFTKNWKKSNPGKMATFNSKRTKARRDRTPAWVTKHQWNQIDMFYEVAVTLTKELGIKFEVVTLCPYKVKTAQAFMFLGTYKLLLLKKIAKKVIDNGRTTWNTTKF